MPIDSNAANTRVPRDIRTYRSKIDSDPPTKGEIKEHLKAKDGGKWNNPSDAQLKAFHDGYKDFAYWQSKTNKNVPQRLGGGLDLGTPNHLGNNLPKPVPNTTFNWIPPGAKNPISIEVRLDGAVVHTGKPEAHEYMHAVFDDILYATRDLLEAINLALEAYANDPTPANSAAYQQAVLDFGNFLADLQPGGGSPYAAAFNSVGIAPVVTNEGFIVSTRVKLNWKNPFHSSSTIKIP